MRLPLLVPCVEQAGGNDFSPAGRNRVIAMRGDAVERAALELLDWTGGSVARRCDRQRRRSPEEKVVATYNAALRSDKSSINGADQKQAQAALGRMLCCAEAAEGWRKSRWLSQIVELANEQGNRRLIRKVIASVR